MAKNTKEFWAWMVVRQGRLRRTIQEVPIYDRFYEDWDGIKACTIFLSKSGAYAWRDRWKNADDFDILRIKIPTV